MYLYDLTLTRHRPELENNPKLTPETQPKYSQIRPKPIGSGRLVRFSGGSDPLLSLRYIYRGLNSCSIERFMEIYEIRISKSDF